VFVRTSGHVGSFNGDGGDAIDEGAMLDEYKRNADECLRMASQTHDEQDRRSWLRLAEGWDRMTRTAQRFCPDEFRAQEYARCTGQAPSWAWH
jgi:hypothetical protein